MPVRKQDCEATILFVHKLYNKPWGQKMVKTPGDKEGCPEDFFVQMVAFLSVSAS